MSGLAYKELKPWAQMCERCGQMRSYTPSNDGLYTISIPAECRDINACMVDANASILRHARIDE